MAFESQLWLKVAVWCLLIVNVVFVISNVQILEYALPVHLHGMSTPCHMYVCC